MGDLLVVFGDILGNIGQQYVPPCHDRQEGRGNIYNPRLFVFLRNNTCQNIHWDLYLYSLLTNITINDNLTSKNQSTVSAEAKYKVQCIDSMWDLLSKTVYYHLKFIIDIRVTLTMFI